MTIESVGRLRWRERPDVWREVRVDRSRRPIRHRPESQSSLKKCKRYHTLSQLPF